MPSLKRRFAPSLVKETTLKKRFLAGFVACALIALAAVVSATAASRGAANNVALGIAQSNPNVTLDNPTGSMTLTAQNLGKSTVYDLSVYIGTGGPGCQGPYPDAYGPFGPPPPLVLANKPTHMNPERESFTGYPYGGGARWHIVKLAHGQQLALKLSFKIPVVQVPLFPAPDPNNPYPTNYPDPSTLPTAPMAQLCITATLNGDTDNSYGPVVMAGWNSPYPEGQ